MEVMESWREYFPLTECRPSQAEALDFIVESFAEHDDIFLEAPTGVGKSAIAIAVGRWLATQGHRSFIATATVSLEEQYVKDFYKLGLRQLHSKSWYTCPQCGTCDLGSAKIKVTGGDRKRCTEEEACVYACAKSEFLASDLSISNNAFLLTNARFVPSWHPRELAIFDEAHLLHDAIADRYSITIMANDRHVRNMPTEGDELEWVQECYVGWLSCQIGELEEEFDRAVRRKVTYQEISAIFKKLETARRKSQNIVKLLSGDSEQWVFDLKPEKLDILPIWAKQLAPDLLPKIGRKRIYMSATLPGFQQQARYLGIDPAKAAHLSLSSPFPVDHRLIHVCPVVQWPTGKNYRNNESAIVATCIALEKILKLHPDDRGLVHVSSYVQAQQIVQRCGNRRLVTHENSKDKEGQMARMFETPGAVLVSPSSHEGLDVFGDRSRFQVIAKMPNSATGDKRVKRRMDTDKSWYTLNTAQKLIQACGRSIRSDADYAVTYILDERFSDFFYNRNGERFLPAYFIEALRKEEVDI
jgi:ATP-dependent DNA helicase DinG